MSYWMLHYHRSLPFNWERTYPIDYQTLRLWLRREKKVGVDYYVQRIQVTIPWTPTRSQQPCHQRPCQQIFQCPNLTSLAGAVTRRWSSRQRWTVDTASVGSVWPGGGRLRRGRPVQSAGTLGLGSHMSISFSGKLVQLLSSFTFFQSLVIVAIVGLNEILCTLCASAILSLVLLLHWIRESFNTIEGCRTYTYLRFAYHLAKFLVVETLLWTQYTNYSTLCIYFA